MKLAARATLESVRYFLNLIAHAIERACDAAKRMLTSCMGIHALGKTCRARRWQDGLR